MIITIENARIGFRNFSGKEGEFNPAGVRNFAVFLEDGIAEKLREDGWNVKWLKARDPEDADQAFLKVFVAYENVPPRIYVVTARGKTEMTAETVGMLDWAQIVNVDVDISSYRWSKNGKSGIKAYAKQMYVTIAEDPLENKYRNVPDSAASSVLNGDEA